jgi:hypothetical protein
MLNTGSWYKQQAERRIRASVDVRYDMIDVLNRAGMELLEAREWTESLNDTWTLRAKKGEDFIAFPREVVRMNGTIKTANARERVELIGLAELRRKAQRNDLPTDTDNLLWYAAPDGRRGPTPADAAERGLRLFPTPSTDDSPTLYISGSRGWRPFTETNLEQKPSICEHWHRAYFLAVCCVAQETKAPEDGPAPERPALEAAIEALWRHEEAAVTDMGELKGAVDRMYEIEELPVDWNNSAQNP